MLVPGLILLLGLAVGALLAWLVLRSQTATLTERIAGRDRRVSDLEAESTTLQARIATLNEEVKALTSSLAESEAKLPTRDEAQTRFIAQFENLANKILEDKSKRFTEQNKLNLDLILQPLAAQIQEFKQRVNEVYDKESKERFSLGAEIQKL